MTETADHELSLLPETPARTTAKLEWHPNVFTDPAAKNRTEQIERWAVELITSHLESLLDGAQVLHRGDLDVRTRNRPLFKVVGDLDVSWEGRSGIFESHGYMPRIGARHRIWDQGLNVGADENYLAEQRRSGRPFYVIWAWWATDDLHPRVTGNPGADLLGPGYRIAGKRVDQLGRPHDSSLGAGLKSYWPLSELWTLEKVADDFRSWNGMPYQESLL
jgi:hypothetical protein